MFRLCLITFTMFTLIATIAVLAAAPHVIVTQVIIVKLHFYFTILIELFLSLLQFNLGKILKEIQLFRNFLLSYFSQYSNVFFCTIKIQIFFRLIFKIDNIGISFDTNIIKFRSNKIIILLYGISFYNFPKYNALLLHQD